MLPINLGFPRIGVVVAWQITCDVRKRRRHSGAAGGFSGARFERNPSENLARGVAGALGGLVAHQSVAEA